MVDVQRLPFSVLRYQGTALYCPTFIKRSHAKKIKFYPKQPENSEMPRNKSSFFLAGSANNVIVLNKHSMVAISGLPANHGEEITKPGHHHCASPGKLEEKRRQLLQMSRAPPGHRRILSQWAMRAVERDISQILPPPCLSLIPIPRNKASCFFNNKMQTVYCTIILFRAQRPQLQLLATSLIFSPVCMQPKE